MYQYVFARNLCRICQEKHISTEELAEAIGRSPRQVSRYRNGQCENISLRTMENAAAFLGVPLSELIAEKGS